MKNIMKNAVNYIFEINQLKYQAHTGWWKIGVKNPVTVAEHSLRAAQIGYILAIMEGDASPEKVVTMLAFHDNGETRIGDQDKISSRYFSTKEAELAAITEQNELLPEKAQTELKNYYQEYKERNTKEGIIAKDADWLETAFQAKEYLDLGHKAAQNWIDNVEKALETDSAKKLIAEMKETTFTDWFMNLKKMTYKKL